MRRIVWVAGVALMLAIGMLAFAGCSHKAVETGGPTTEVTGKTPESTTTPEAAKNPEGTPSTPSGSFSFEDVHFAYDDASLNDEARQILSGTGAYMAKNDSKVEVEGHCDERGSVEYNLALGERRANNVRDYLVSYGISSGRISTVSYGKERPLDPGHTEDAWAKNRRAHFVSH
ncbi:MAG TPA: peptidoglycan-associated lipoprotein Pal [Candidatus Saccharimonadales bacterium]|nr:peptidoglycan-associated lipoprotein Pal [Candidatus Saccharimonadales bacterium]